MNESDRKVLAILHLDEKSSRNEEKSASYGSFLGVDLAIVGLAENWPKMAFVESL